MYGGYRIGLSVVNYNSSEKLIEYISRLRCYETIDYIAVTDNGSSAASWEKLRELEGSDKIRLMRSETNRGYSFGQNIGCRYLREEKGADYIIIMSPCVYFEESVLKELIEKLDGSKEKYAVMAPVAKDIGTREQKFRCAWKRPTYFDLVCSCLWFMNRKYAPLAREDYRTDDCGTDGIMTVETVLGSMYLIRADILEKIDYFDEDLFLYNEENVISHKLNSIGYSEGIACGLEFFNEQGFSANSNLSVMKRFGHLLRSQFVYAKKYLKVSKPKLLALYLLRKFGMAETAALITVRPFVRMIKRALKSQADSRNGGRA